MFHLCILAGPHQVIVFCDLFSGPRTLLQPTLNHKEENVGFET